MSDEFEFNEDHEKNFHLYKDNLPEDLSSMLESMFDLLKFADREQGFRKAAEPLLFGLMMKHFPEFRDLKHPAFMKKIKETVESTAMMLASSMNSLATPLPMDPDFETQHPNVNEMYTMFVGWDEPPHITPHDRKDYPEYSDQEFEERMNDENEMEYAPWLRHKEFVELVQPLLFRCFPELQKLEGDQWKALGVNIEMEYQGWVDDIETILCALQFDLPPESLAWPHERFEDALENAIDARAKKNRESRKKLDD